MFILFLAVSVRHKQRDLTRSKKTALLRVSRGRISEADPALRNLLDSQDWDGTPTGLRPFLAFRFSKLPQNLTALDAGRTHSFVAQDATDVATLDVIRQGAVLTVRINDRRSENAGEAHAALYRKDQTKTLARAVDSAPYPVWMTDADGRVAWSNRAYQQLESAVGGARADGRPILDLNDRSQNLADREQHRCRLKRPDQDQDQWFDVSEDQNGGHCIFHATDVTAVVQAEAAQRTFVQTLTKTFAQLSIGLAIFDRNRQLALFNPALIDLTELSAEFLSGRPSFLSFFDKLRDEKILPEPRNYTSWRDQILDLIAKAEDGRYQETWTLTSGNTYRVTGRPHPNGAVAFLFEDISAEVTLTRRFREQLDLSQAVMETLDDAIAVFSPQGMLSYTNPAYRKLWKVNEEASALDMSVSDVSRHWQDLSEPNPIWGDFRDFVVGFEERTDWNATILMRDGRPVDCQFKPLQGGATLAHFRVMTQTHLMSFQSAN